MSKQIKYGFCTSNELIGVKPPQKTATYSPVPHKIVIDATLEALDKANIKVLSSLYKSAADGKQANGIYQLSGGDSEMNFQLIWQNSYNKSLPLASAMGTHVIVCGNGMVCGDMGRFKRKHTGNVLKEFEEEIGMYINQSGEIFQKMVHDRERMKEIELTKVTCAELIGRMFLNEDLITTTQLGIIKRELENPSFNYGSGLEKSLWNVYNACTVSLKEAHPELNMKQHIDLHNYISKEFSIN